MADPIRLHILDTPVDVVDMAGALAFVEARVRAGGPPGCILAVNPEKVYALRTSQFLRDFFEQAALLIPDGIGMVWAMRCLHHAPAVRVPGADLMQAICAAAPAKGYRLFVYGAREDVNAGAVAELQRRHPGIQFVGRANGYVPDAELPALVQRINDSGADILFVALGSPRQEQWLHANLAQLRVKLCQGIGGTLDTITGHVQRAPVWMQRLNLEWFYRLLKQPTRVGRQMRLARFALAVIAARLRGHPSA